MGGLTYPTVNDILAIHERIVGNDSLAVESNRD